MKHKIYLSLFISNLFLGIISGEGNNKYFLFNNLITSSFCADEIKIDINLNEEHKQNLEKLDIDLETSTPDSLISSHYLIAHYWYKIPLCSEANDEEIKYRLELILRWNKFITKALPLIDQSEADPSVFPLFIAFKNAFFIMDQWAHFIVDNAQNKYELNYFSHDLYEYTAEFYIKILFHLSYHYNKHGAVHFMNKFFYA